MKKKVLFFMFLSMLSYTISANASSISLESTQSFYPSQWIVESRPINVNISNFDETNANLYFSLILPEDSNIRFSEDFSAIKFLWAAANKVWSGFVLMPNLRELKFQLKETFKNWDAFDITWLKLKTYSKPQWDRYIWIDLNGDSASDAVSPNWYRVLSTYAYSDTLAPSEVFDLTWSIVDNRLTLSAIMPWDVDFQWVTIENLDKDWNVLSSIFRNDLNNYTYELQSNYDSIRIKTIDTRANYSAWLTYKLDLFRAQEVDSSTTEVTSTWTTTQTWTIEPETNVVEPEIVVDTVEKYYPVFIVNERLLNKVVAYVEEYIVKHPLKADSETNESSITIIRNKLYMELENLDTASSIEKPQIVINIRTYFKELALELKK